MKPDRLLSHVCSRENNEIHTVYKNEPVHPPSRANWREGKCLCVCEEGVLVHYEPSNVMLLVICSETRGE